MGRRAVVERKRQASRRMGETDNQVTVWKGVGLSIKKENDFTHSPLRCVRDSNISRNPLCTNILFNQVFKVQRLIQRERFAVLLNFDSY